MRNIAAQIEDKEQELMAFLSSLHLEELQIKPENERLPQVSQLLLSVNI